MSTGGRVLDGVVTKVQDDLLEPRGIAADRDSRLGVALDGDTAQLAKGDVVNGRGDSPNMHDVLTGSRPDGTAFPASGNDMTCRNWSHAGEGAAMVGHHDRTGLDESPPAKSWNSSHPTRGCSQDDLVATGGAGLLYCFSVTQ